MILLNNFEREYQDIGQACLKNVDAVLRSSMYILGNQVEEFELNLAKYWQRDWAVGCGNGMDAIEISLRALGLKPGEKVVTTPMTAFATTLAIVRVGGAPVLVDVDQNGNLDLDRLEELLTEDNSIRFLVPVHLYGIPLDLNKLERMKKKYKLVIVEDCAQAIGARFETRTVGSVGELAAVSFYPTKNLGAFGDGGAVLGCRSDLEPLVRGYRNYGQSEKYVHEWLGLNSRLDEVQASWLDLILTTRLKKYISRRQQIANYYLENIKNSGLRLAEVDKRAEPVWHIFPVFIAGDRKKLMSYCTDNEVQTAIHYPLLINQQKAMEKVKFEIWLDLTQAKDIAEHEMSIPINPYLTDVEVEKVVATLNSYSE